MRLGRHTRVFTSALDLWTVGIGGTSFERALVCRSFGTFRRTRSIGRYVAVGDFSAGGILRIYRRCCACGDRSLVFAIARIITRIAKRYRTNLWCTLQVYEKRQKITFYLFSWRWEMRTYSFDCCVNGYIYITVSAGGSSLCSTGAVDAIAAAIFHRISRFVWLLWTAAIFARRQSIVGHLIDFGFPAGKSMQRWCWCTQCRISCIRRRFDGKRAGHIACRLHIFRPCRLLFQRRRIDFGIIVCRINWLNSFLRWRLMRFLADWNEVEFFDGSSQITWQLLRFHR